MRQSGATISISMLKKDSKRNKSVGRRIERIEEINKVRRIAHH
tara:strand:- start:818 stop:946 length:129 start_codon:yes stop_codon:yes gene_type:complete